MTKKQIILLVTAVAIVTIIGSEMLAYYNPRIYNKLCLIAGIMLSVLVLTIIVAYFINEFKRNCRGVKIDSGISEKNKRYFKKINKEKNKR